MKITVKYSLEGEELEFLHAISFGPLIEHITNGPLSTGLDAANRQLEDKGKNLRLKIIDVEVE